MRIVNYPSIKGPYCENNVYFNFQEALKKPEEVKVLQITGPCNSLAGISKLTALGILHIDQTWESNPQNCLAELPEEIGDLENLFEVHLESIGRLTTIPASIGRLSRLQIVHIEGTYLKVKELPEEIGELANLETLYIDFKQLKVIPESIGRLKRLKTLVIRGTRVSELPEEVQQLKSLSYLLLEHNQKVSRKNGTKEANLYKYFLLEQLKNCKQLIMDNNLLHCLPDGFDGFPQLEVLEVKSTKGIAAKLGNCARLKQVNVWLYDDEEKSDYDSLFKALSGCPQLYRLTLGKKAQKTVEENLPGGTWKQNYSYSIYYDRDPMAPDYTAPSPLFLELQAYLQPLSMYNRWHDPLHNAHVLTSYPWVTGNVDNR